ncbi:MAG TPA: glycosyltransferase [Longimicrobiaceae bacterium]|jgi:spore maturation protein CgeB|nr:glycosyltransferase [Longimicrobiaceae bacterium]
MRFVFFIHSAVSDWNHGNAHFVRGLMTALARRGHTVDSWEPRGAWSVENLLADHGVGPIVDFARAFPEIAVHSYDGEGAGLEDEVAAAVAGADVVIVHEWNTPRVANTVAAVARRQGSVVLFHDTHHRPWSDPDAIARFDLAAFDGVLAFGDVLRDIYRERFGVERAWTFHEAADVERFRPLNREKTQDVAWIGNWGDGERTEELRAFWLDSARAMPELRFVAHGVRYPAEALAELADAGVEFRGWAPSLRVPEVFAASRVTLHVPRRAYVQALRGIPTIRVFEALACGIPLVSAPWLDAERLFRPGDYASVETPREMREQLLRFACDDDARLEQAARGLETILARHTCGHRADELLSIVAALQSAGASASPVRVSGDAHLADAERRASTDGVSVDAHPASPAAVTSTNGVSAEAHPSDGVAASASSERMPVDDAHPTITADALASANALASAGASSSTETVGVSASPATTAASASTESTSAAEAACA